MHKIKPCTLSARTVENNLKGTIERFAVISVKGTPACWKQFLYGVLAMVKQLGTTTCFLTLSSADFHIIEKLNNLGLSEEDFQYKARHFQYNV